MGMEQVVMETHHMARLRERRTLCTLVPLHTCSHNMGWEGLLLLVLEDLVLQPGKVN